MPNQSNSTQGTGSKRVIEELLTAMSWMEPPFVDDSTPLEEIRQRIGLMIEDKERALKYARKRGELSVYQECPNPYSIWFRTASCAVRMLSNDQRY